MRAVDEGRPVFEPLNPWAKAESEEELTVKLADGFRRVSPNSLVLRRQ